jgi:hypothetical protein
MYLGAEIDVSVDAVASMTAKLGTIGGGAERERAQQCAARASQTVADGGEADDPRFDNDLILVVAVTGQDDSTIAAEMLTHDDTDLLKRGRRGGRDR